MTADGTHASRPTSEDRPVALAVARVHLRTGALALARAELEAAAGDRRLDDDAIVDLAEARWRTGDTVGAGQAAAVHLAAGGDDLVALVIAAEAAAIARGGAAEAESLVAQVLDRRQAPMADLVAGMPLAAPWPPGMDDDAAADRVASATSAASWRPGSPAARSPRSCPSAPAARSPARSADPCPPRPSRRPQPIRRRRSPPAPRPWPRAIAMARRLHLAVALRLSPALAPAILSAVGGTPGPAFDLLRGDAFRLVGHESDARRAYAAVARSLAIRDGDAAAESAADTSGASDAGTPPGAGGTPDPATPPHATPQEGPS